MSSRPISLDRVPRPKLEDYARKYAEWFVIERNEGVIELRMHANGGPTNFLSGGPWRDVWCQIWHEVGNDPLNKVAIISGTGKYWVEEHEPLVDMASITPAERAFETQSRLMGHIEGMLFGLNMPTIGVLNGPGPALHQEIPLLCDISLAANDAYLRDSHIELGTAPGDGLGLALQALLGPKRAAYYLFTGDPIDAQMLHQLGLVNEIHDRSVLMQRARELARSIASIPDVTRLMTTQIVRRPLRKRYVEDMGFHLTHEQVGALAGEQKSLMITIERDREYMARMSER